VAANQRKSESWAAVGINEAVILGKIGRPKKGKEKGSREPLIRGDNNAYWFARLNRDRPWPARARRSPMRGCWFIINRPNRKNSPAAVSESLPGNAAATEHRAAAGIAGSPLPRRSREPL